LQLTTTIVEIIDVNRGKAFSMLIEYFIKSQNVPFHLFGENCYLQWHVVELSWLLQLLRNFYRGGPFSLAID